MSNLTDPIPLSSLTGMNAGLTSASVDTMIELMGAPREPLIQDDCRDDQASPMVKRLLETRRMTPRFRLSGIKPALDSVEGVLAKVKVAHPELIDQLDTPGMICVRHKNPTDGSVSHEASNHSWGTAVDFNLVGMKPPGNTGTTLPRWVAMLIPFFNEAGWFSGAGFRHAKDMMHFEVAEETIRQWAREGKLGPAPSAEETVVAGGSSGGSTGAGNSSSGSGSVLSGIGNFFSGLFGRG